MRIYATEQLGPTQATTPEGFLLCSGVAIARTGEQIYGPGEVPLQPGRNLLTTVIRDEAEVFSPVTIASFEGKPVTIDHPPTGVTPDNWQGLAVGTVQNVRRGDTYQSDLLVADLLITDATAIDLVRTRADDDGRPVRPLREVSCGYDAEYEQKEPGIGYQRNIIGNHVALVERGRAGPRCSIQDGVKPMKTQDKATWMNRIRSAFITKDGSELEAALNDTPTEDAAEDDPEMKKTNDTLANLTKTVDAIAAQVAKLTKDAEEKAAEEEENKKTEDNGEELTEPGTAGKADNGTTYTGDQLADIASRVEILVPGFAMPTTDSIKTGDSVAKLQRQVLTEVAKTADGKKAVDLFVAGRTLDKMSADAVHTVFLGASEAMRSKNNASNLHARTKDFGPATTVAAINQANKDFWSKRSN